jgi:PAS domain S-box-containing protein
MPIEELKRLAAVHRFLNLEINRKEELGNIVRLAAEICKTPTALITFLDDKTQFIKFNVGIDREQTEKKDAFCLYTINGFEVMVVEDAMKDARFNQNPLVIGDPKIRFYAGAPLTTHDGQNLGSLCVIAQKPRKLTANQKRMLGILSSQVIQILEFEMSIQVLKEQFIKARNSEIKLRSFFDSSVSCHLLMGKNFEILAHNKTLEVFIFDLFGVLVKEGMDIRKYVHQAHLGNFRESYEKALCGETIISERQLSYPNKIVYWYMVYEPAYTSDGAIIGVSLNATDITERIKQEQLVILQNESLKKIAFIQSHELRRPVSTIMGLMNLIKEENYYTEEREELMMLEKAVEELDDRIRTIVDYTFSIHSDSGTLPAGLNI